jgi:hypothetical protein
MLVNETKKKLKKKRKKQEKTKQARMNFVNPS